MRAEPGRGGVFEVWAPLATRVSLVADGTDIAMTAADAGWFRARVAEPVQDYGFRLDDDPAVRPDPRSRRQPDGVHQLSRTDNPADFAWTDSLWTGRSLPGAVLYELHIGTFTPLGTFDAAIDKLDHLVDLGITHVEVLPVNGFNGTHNWGYDGVAWFTVHEGYGGPDGYRRFVDACHARGLAVVQDVVHNHLGPSGNYLPLFGPYLHDAHANSWGSSVNLDGKNSEEVRSYIRDNVEMWFTDFHVDGLRLDAVHALVDHRAVHLLEELAEDTDRLAAHLGRPLVLIAESDRNDPATVTAREAGGLGLDAQWSDDFHHALHVALTGETVGYYADFAPLASLATVFEEGFFHAGTLSTFRGRVHGRPIDRSRLPADRLVVSTQTHDQIGNRAVGDRLSQTLSPERLRLGALVLLCSPFTPMLFMGEEWGAGTPWQFFTSHPEADLGRATAEGRIGEFAEMGWDPAVVPDPQDPQTFERSKLDWSETGRAPHDEILDFHRTLLRLRRREAALTDPALHRVRASADGAVLRVHRGDLLLLANFGDTPATLPPVDGARTLLATGSSVLVTGRSIILPGGSGALLRLT